MNLKSVSFIDRIFMAGEIYGIKDYTITLKDCDNNIIFNKEFLNPYQISPDVDEIGTIKFTEYL